MLCSNPDCGALTSGPTSEAAGAVLIGEAAHIYGRTSTSARFKEGMTEAELSDIPNGIWLCRNCHKLIDNDGARFPADLLFQWKRAHDAVMTARLGRPGDQLREKTKLEHLGSLGNISYLAQQIILDRPAYWEYKLAAEILRSELQPIQAKLNYLQRGMYTRPGTIVSLENVSQWISAKSNDAQNLISAFAPLINALYEAWGAPGVAGDDKAIVEVCKMIAAAAANILAWEEEIHFVHVQAEFREPIAMLRGMMSKQLDDLFKMPRALLKPFEQENFSGVNEIKIRFSIPDNLARDFKTALDRAVRNTRRK